MDKDKEVTGQIEDDGFDDRECEKKSRKRWRCQWKDGQRRWVKKERWG